MMIIVALSYLLSGTMELQRLYLLVTISLLVVVSASVLPAGAATEFCVVPTEQSLCPCSVICHTFDFYLTSPELYFKSGVTFQFLPGVHNVSRSFSGSNITDMVFNATNATLMISRSTDSWFTFHNSSQISLSGLNFISNLSGSNPSICTCILQFNNVTDIELLNVLLNNSCGAGMGLQIENVNGFIEISESHFYGSGIVFNSELAVNTTMSIYNSKFYNAGMSMAVSDISPNNTASFSLNVSHVESATRWDVGPNTEVLARNPTADIIITNSDEVLENVLLQNKKIQKIQGISLDFSSFSERYSVIINNCSILSHGQTALKIELGSNQLSEVVVQNCIVKGNQGDPTDHPVSGLLIQGQAGSAPVIMRNVTFESNTYISSASIDAVVTVLLASVPNVTMIDCTFKENIGTALYLENTTLTAIGVLTFAGNMAYKGAALFIRLSTIVVYRDTTIYFSNNKANHTGGAISISSHSDDQVLVTLGISLAKCFLSIEDYDYSQCQGNSCVLIFDNNTAHDGGDAIYGGNLDQVKLESKVTCIQVVESLSEFHQNTASLISSSPTRVCLCENHTPQCLEYNRNITVYPGQVFNISAFAVGQHFGSSKGTIFAQILNKSSGVSVSNQSKVHTVDQHSCDDSSNLLSYRVLMPQGEGSETVVLTTEDISVSQYINKQAIMTAIEKYKEDNSSVPLELLTLPVFINIEFLKCPNGFSHSATGCVCTSIFSALSCDIDTQTVQRQHSVWIDASNTTARYSQYCPLLYCNSALVQVNLSQRDGADAQCVNHHSGVLCGACKMGYSLAIGSSHCLPHCSDNYLSLLLVLAAAGVLLVLFIKYLNLTVTQGMINGLIFCTNIVQTNKSVLLASDETAVKFFAAFIAWFNLDFGIETCFSEDLDIYTKTWLQFAFPLYLWVLAGGIIVACRYSQLATRFFGNNAVHVLATIFLLSYNKLLRIITTVYSSASIEIQDLSSNHTREEAVWAYDGNIRYLSSEHAALFAACTFVFVFLWLPFTLCILLGQWLQRYNHYRGLQWVGRVRPLLEAYYGPLKDRHRYWAGILLLARVVVIIPAADPLASASASLLTVIILCLVLFSVMAIVGGFYKKIYLSILENILLLNLSLFPALSLYFNSTDGKQEIAVYISVGLYFVVFLGIVGFQLYCLVLKVAQKIKCSPKIRRDTYLDLQNSVGTVSYRR